MIDDITPVSASRNKELENSESVLTFKFENIGDVTTNGAQVKTKRRLINQQGVLPLTLFTRNQEKMYARMIYIQQCCLRIS